MSVKRKHISVPLKTKYEALKRIDAGETNRAIAKALGVGEVTVGDWKRNRLKIEQWYENGLIKDNNLGLSRSRMRKSDYEKTSEALYLWYTNEQKIGNPITVPMLQRTAKYYQMQYKEGETDFCASLGWIEKWKRRYGLKNNISNKENGKINKNKLKDNNKIKNELPEKNINFNSQEIAEVKQQNTHLSNVKLMNNLTHENENVKIEKISNYEGLKSLEATLKYIEQQPESTKADILFMQKWIEVVTRRLRENFQTKITDYFTNQKIGQ